MLLRRKLFENFHVEKQEGDSIKLLLMEGYACYEHGMWKELIQVRLQTRDTTLEDLNLDATLPYAIKANYNNSTLFFRSQQSVTLCKGSNIGSDSHEYHRTPSIVL
jgi:hypothetical protein